VLADFALDGASRTPLHKQIYRELRLAIISGRFRPGTKLPATRVLAAELGVSRNTIITVFEDLRSEGYLQSRVGDGTYVADTLPEDHLLPDTTAFDGFHPTPIGGQALSSRGRMLAEVSTLSDGEVLRPFCGDIPALDAFPTEAWGRLLVKCWHKITPSMLGQSEAAGYEPLRVVIAQHLRVARSVRCDADQVIVTSGSQQSLDLIARLLTDPGDPIWIEEPGYIGARAVFAAAGAKIVPVPVDQAGLNIDVGLAREPKPKVIFVSPSRQYPLGATLSAERRIELLRVAEATGAWIIEDDYDNEFRYHGTALPAMQGLGNAGRVIYLGTFTKSLLPALHLGFLVVPKDLVRSFITAKSVITRHAPILEQMAVYEFMESGHFAAHVRKMRQIYLERLTTLMNHMSQRLADVITVLPAKSGMHVVGFFDGQIDDNAFCKDARQRGITLRPLSIYYAQEPKRTGLILGFAATPSARIVTGVERLRKFATEFLTEKAA
jgi:GntR family transcriptional regulator / MocR family aminotransferase